MDLDGTLIAADLFWEALLRLIFQAPWVVFLLPFWALQGRAFLKRQVAARVAIDAATLPYREELLDRLRDAHLRGVPLVLATAADESYARAVREHLGIFTDVVASDGRVNLSGANKARVLSERYGTGRFHYIGNGWADFHVWIAGGSATIVGAPARLIRSIKQRVQVRAVIQPSKAGLAPLVRALRPHQWVKNLLVFVPLITSHQIFSLVLSLDAAVAFVAFSACASGIYILNDIADVQSDRLHPRKKHRPFAAGELSLPFGLVTAGMLLVGGLAFAGMAGSWELAAILGGYVALSTAYTMALKREPVIDVFFLAGLYVLRVVAGGVATGIVLSTWLLAFAMFLFLSLAFVKRYTELAGNGRTPGRGYTTRDTPWMHAIGTSSGYMAVVVMALYVSAPDVTMLYSRPRALWLFCPLLLFWITRLWFRAGRGQVDDDPVVEALKDPAGYISALLAGVILVLSL